MRLETVCFIAAAMVDGWYIKYQVEEGGIGYGMSLGYYKGVGRKGERREKQEEKQEEEKDQ